MVSEWVNHENEFELNRVMPLRRNGHRVKSRTSLHQAANDTELIRLLRDTRVTGKTMLNPLEEAEAFNRLLATGYVPSRKVLAEEVCRGPQYVYGRMVLYEAPEALHRRIDAFGVSIAETLARVFVTNKEPYTSERLIWLCEFALSEDDNGNLTPREEGMQLVREVCNRYSDKTRRDKAVLRMVEMMDGKAPSEE